MASVEQVQLRLRNVAEIRLCAVDREEGIALSPDNQHLRLLIPKEGMPRLILREVRLVVVQQVQLDRVIAGAVQEELIEGVGVRVDAGYVLNAVRILEDRRLFREQSTHGG